MKFFNPSDFYDNILQTIQQFPMEVYYYKRHSKRILKVIEKYNSKLDRVVKSLPKVNLAKCEKIESKLSKAHEQHRDLVYNLLATINKHIEFYDRLNELGNKPIQTNLLSFKQNLSMTVKVKDDLVDDKLYCSCNTKATGNMICCNNPKCEIKWYHYKCVGILKTPKTAWTCSRCIDK